MSAKKKPQARAATKKAKPPVKQAKKQAKPKEKRGKGRPSKYSPAIADEICERLLKGESMVAICKDAHMPNYATVWRWQNEHEEFRNDSARAKKDGTHYMAGDCVRIADDTTIDPQHKRLMIDTRMRLIGKWNAPEYGDKLDVNAQVVGDVRVVIGSPD